MIAFSKYNKFEFVEVIVLQRFYDKINFLNSYSKSTINIIKYVKLQIRAT